MTTAVSYAEAVVLEHSDERLAKVEEAKRTGMPFESTSNNGELVVPIEVAAQIMEEFSQLDTYVGRHGATYAGHLENYHENIKDQAWVLNSNEEKAAQHEEHSRHVEQMRREEDADTRERLKDDPDAAARDIRERNERLAQEHNDRMAEYEEWRQDRSGPSATEVVEESVRLYNENNLAEKPLEERADALAAVNDVPNAMEDEARESLIVKDAIVATEEDFLDHAVDSTE